MPQQNNIGKQPTPCTSPPNVPTKPTYPKLKNGFYEKRPMMTQLKSVIRIDNHNWTHHMLESDPKHVVINEATKLPA